MLNSEQILLSGLNERNREAIHEWFLQHYRPFCIYAYGHLQNMSDAEGVVHDAFIRFQRSKPRFKELHAIYLYMRTTIHNLCMDVLNSKTAKIRHLFNVRFLSPKSQEAHNETPAAIELDLIRVVYAEIENLPGRQKEILKMYYKEGMSVNEIAEKLNISTKTVLNIRQTGLKTLKLALGRKSTTFLLLLQLWLLISNKFRF